MNPEQSSKVYKVRRPDGQIWDIPEQNIDKAISLGGKVVNDFDNQPSPSNENPIQNQEKVFKVRRPDGQIWDIPEKNLEKAKEMGGTIVDEDPNYNDAGKTLARSAKTLGASATGGLVDTATSIYNTPASLENAKTPEMKKNSPSSFVPESFVPEPSPYPDAQIPLIPSAEHAIESKIDEATGGYTKTANGDSTQAALRMVGAVASPGGLAKGAAKAGLKGVTTVLAGLGTTKPVGLVGAGAAGAVSSEAEKAGYGGVASAALGLGAGAATSLAASLRPENIKIALATLTGNSPKNINLEALKAAESLGLDYQNTLVNKSKGLAIADQFVSKAPITGSRQAAKNKKIDDSFVEAVEKSINKVGQKIIDSDSALDTGSMLKDTFVNIKDNIKEESNILYNNSANSLSKKASAIPHNMVIEIKKLRKSINTLDPSSDEINLLKHLDKIESQLYSTAKTSETKLALGHDLELKFIPNEDIPKRTLEQIPIKKIIGTKVSLNDTIDWDINASGVKNKLKLLQRAALKDLEDYGKTNPKWYNQFQEADKYYGKFLGDKGFANNTFYKKIFGQEDPEKIMGSLRNISDFKKIGQVLETAPDGKKFFDSIKREKLADLFMGKIIDPKTDAVTYTNFSKVLESPQNKELVKYLSGDRYADLQNFSKYAKANVERSRRVPNPSGTASTLKFLDHLEALGGGLVGTGFGTGGLGGAAIAAGGLAATTTACSWLVNNKKYLKIGIEAAKKQAAGDIKNAGILSNRLERSMINDLGDDFVRQFLALSSEN